VSDSHRGRLANDELKLRIELPNSPAMIEGDEGRLRQMLDNLLENARRYTHAPGEVALRLERLQRHWRIVLEDSAPGVPHDDLPRLFERLFRVDRSRSRAGGGFGLGLAICRNIALAHDGLIEASASPLGGLRLTIELPRSTAPVRVTTA